MSATVIVYLYNLLLQTVQNTNQPEFWDWLGRVADSIGILTLLLGAVLAWRAKNELQKLRELINRVNLVQDITDVKRVLLEIQSLHLDAHEISLRRAIDRYATVHEQLARIKEQTTSLTREQRSEILKVLAELRAMQNAAAAIMLARDRSHGQLDAAALGTFDVVDHNSKLTAFSETLEKLLADTTKGLGV